jgi:transketolase N-terminal domain/subunit
MTSNNDNLDSDLAMSSIAHTIRTYYMALMAEGFHPAEAIGLAAAYQTALLSTAAAMPPLQAT